MNAFLFFGVLWIGRIGIERGWGCGIAFGVLFFLLASSSLDRVYWYGLRAKLLFFDVPINGRYVPENENFRYRKPYLQSFASLLEAFTPFCREKPKHATHFRFGGEVFLGLSQNPLSPYKPTEKLKKILKEDPKVCEELEKYEKSLEGIDVFYKAGLGMLLASIPAALLITPFSPGLGLVSLMDSVVFGASSLIYWNINPDPLLDLIDKAVKIYNKSAAVGF